MFIVTNLNLLKILPQIEDDIQQSSVIVFDLEMSGMEYGCFSLMMTMQQRYELMKEMVNKYSIIQLGITFIKPNHEQFNGYKSSTYIFYLNTNLNKVVTNSGDCINFRIQTLSFLNSNRLDFRKWLNSGLMYISELKRAKFLENMNGYIEKFCFELNQDVECGFSSILTWLHYYQLDKNVDDNNYSRELILSFKPRENEIFNYYFLYKIRIFLIEDSIVQQYLDDDEILWCDLFKNDFEDCFKVYMVRPYERRRMKWISFTKEKKDLYKIIEKDKNLLISKICALTDIFQKIRSTPNVNIVGHNFLYDLSYIYQNFFAPLPEKFEEFNFELNKVFPQIYDTKLIGQKAKILGFRYRSLFSCLTILLEKKFNNCIPELSVRMFHNYLDEQKDTYFGIYTFLNQRFFSPHNAGFDSLVTGFIFLYSGYILMKQPSIINQATIKNKVPYHPYQQNLSNNLLRFRNKLFMPRNRGQPWTIVCEDVADDNNNDGIINNGNVIYNNDHQQQNRNQQNEKLLLKFTTKEAVELFFRLQKQFSSLDYIRIDDYQILILSTHSKKQETFLGCLLDVLRWNNQADSLQIINSVLYEEYSLYRKFCWITLILSLAWFVCQLFVQLFYAGTFSN